MDILFKALRALDTKSNQKAYYRANGPYLYPSEETAFADDAESICSSAEHLQTKADLVSAFCILAGLQLSHDKLRRVLHSTIHTNNTVPLTVYTHPWTPHSVPVNTTDATEYLGGIYDVKNAGK